MDAMTPALFNLDTTIRWSCCAGDYVLWIRFRGLFAPANSRFAIADIWEMKDGNVVTITNRVQDLPEWFELHPSEASDTVTHWMMKKLESGYKPSEPMNGPNLWRVFAGDRLAWVGPSRPDLKPDNGILALIDFRSNALVGGEPFDTSGEWPSFGGFDDRPDLPPQAAALCRKGWLAACELGVPRVGAFDDHWTLGS